MLKEKNNVSFGSSSTFTNFFIYYEGIKVSNLDRSNYACCMKVNLTTFLPLQGCFRISSDTKLRNTGLIW